METALREPLAGAPGQTTRPSASEPRKLIARGARRLALLTPTAKRVAMDLTELTNKAVALRQCFNAAAHADGKREWTREELMQGFVVDVGGLMKLVMAKNGVRDVANVDAKLGHELADCLWSVLVLADSYGIDLEKEFLAMTAAVTAGLECHPPDGLRTS